MERELSFFMYLSSKIEDARENHGEEFSHEILDIVETIPDFLGLMLRLVLDTRLTRDERLFASSALVYLISPEDFIPELSVGIPGLVEDAVLICRTLSLLANDNTRSILNEHWRGKAPLESTLTRIQSISEGFISIDVREAIDLYIRTVRPVPW